jgi:hypothetical protein
MYAGTAEALAPPRDERILAFNGLGPISDIDLFFLGVPDLLGGMASVI